MTRLLLIRHGESEANRNDTFAGQINPDLLERGYAQAKVTAKFIADNFKVDAIYSSDLQRAFKTAKALSDEIGMEIITDTGLREISAGEWEGQDYYGLAEKYPQEFDTWLHDIGHAKCPGGESISELNERFMKTITKIADENTGKTVVIATHATPIRVVVSNIRKGGIEQMSEVPWVSNASVTIVEYNNGIWKLERESLDEHLTELKTVLPENI